MGLSQQDRDFFFEHGYLSVGKILEDEAIEVLRRAYDAEIQRAVEENTFRNLSVNNEETLEKKSGAVAQVYQVVQMCERNIHFRKLLFNPRILDLVEDLIGPNIMLFHDQALFKPARHGGAVFWHQDNGYWRCRPANLVSCWLTLDDVIKESGAMQVIPGSHLRPVHHDKAEATNALLEIHGVDLTRATPIELPAGGCMLHHCQTLHYTAPNETDRQRRAFAMHFMNPGTRGQNGEVLRVGFERPLLRGCL